MYDLYDECIVCIDLYDLHDLYDMYYLYELYELYDLYDMYDLYDVYDLHGLDRIVPGGIGKKQSLQLLHRGSTFGLNIFSEYRGAPWPKVGRNAIFFVEDDSQSHFRLTKSMELPSTLGRVMKSVYPMVLE